MYIVASLSTTVVCFIMVIYMLQIFLILIYFCPACIQKAKRSYQKDIAKLQEVRDSHAQALNDQDEGNEINCGDKICHIYIYIYMNKVWHKMM